MGSFFLAISPLVFSNEIALEYNPCSRMCNYALGSADFPSQAWTILLLFPAFDFTLLGGTIIINIISLTTIRQYSKRRKHLAETESQAQRNQPSPTSKLQDNRHTDAGVHRFFHSHRRFCSWKCAGERMVQFCVFCLLDLDLEQLL